MEYNFTVLTDVFQSFYRYQSILSKFAVFNFPDLGRIRKNYPP